MNRRWLARATALAVVAMWAYGCSGGGSSTSDQDAAAEGGQDGAGGGGGDGGGSDVASDTPADAPFNGCTNFTVRSDTNDNRDISFPTAATPRQYNPHCMEV